MLWKEIIMNGFIEILPGLWYEEKTGLPWSSRKFLGKGWGTDGHFKQLTAKSGRGYYYVGVDGKIKRWHRIVYEYFNGPIPKGKEVDHINNVRSDNRISNLKLKTHKDNSRSCLKYKNNTSGHPGVVWRKENKKWRAQIYINGKNKSLGHFDNKLEAAEAYKKAKIKYHGIDSIRF